MKIFLQAYTRTCFEISEFFRHWLLLLLLLLLMVMVIVMVVCVEVKVTQRLQGYESPQDIRRLKRGDYFGEKALLRSNKHAALSYRVTLYHIYRVTVAPPGFCNRGEVRYGSI